MIIKKQLNIMKKEILNKITYRKNKTFFLLAGPCAIEDEEMAMKIAERLKLITEKLNIPFVFKGSYKKANRTRLDSFTGIGDIKALEILSKVSDEFSVPTITDIHVPGDAEIAAKYVDILQIPAFLVRQTDLLVAAAKTEKIINLKKGQFMGPGSMKFAVQKIKDSGNNNVLLTERGSMFGYNDLIVDFRGLKEMNEYAPTVLDVTHSLQQPNLSSGVTGGRPEMIETLARAGVSIGIDGLFIETHYDTRNAKSDGANMLDLDLVEDLLTKLVKLKVLSDDL